MLLSTAIFNPAQAQTTVTVGSGTGTAYQFPVNHNFEYSYTQTIYTAAEITAAGGASGLIHKLRYLQKTTMSTENWDNWIIYMGHTTKTGFTSKTDWVPVSSMTQVFSGNLPPNSIASTWLEIQLDVPFSWDGVSNIVVGVHENTPDKTYVPNSWGGYVLAPSAGYKGIYYRDNYTNPNPASPPMANLATNTVARIQFGFSVPCSGVPVANLSSGVAAVCSGVPFTLSAASEGTIGITYQYQYSTNGGETWSNLGFATSNAYYVVPNQTMATMYRVQVSCGTGGTAISAPLTVAQNMPTECYCTPATFSATSVYINGFATSGGIININKTSGSAPAGYADFHLSDSASAYAGSEVSFDLNIAGDFSDLGYAVWVDFNENGFFEAAERVAFNSFYVTSPINSSFLIPATTTPGTKRMRVIGIYGDYGLTDPCVQSSHGEYEDYSLVVKPVPVCAGIPTPGATYASSSTLCFGSTVTLGFENHSGVGGLSYAWYASTNGGLSWTLIAGATDSTYTATPSVNTLYRALVTCGTTGDTASSTPVAIDFYNHIASVTPDAICGSGSATLSATSPSASTITWYYSTSDVAPLASGETFTTPALSSTTTFYAAPVSYIPITATVGAGTFTSISGAPDYSGQSPFAYAFGNHKHQMIIRASELIDAGILPGAISSVAFKVIAPTSGTTYATFNNFTVSLKQTTATEMSEYFESGVTVVWTGNYTPITGLNTFTFSAPVIWDGVSNLIVQTCYNNNDGGDVDKSAEVAYDNTMYPSHTIFRMDGMMPTICEAYMGNSFSDGPVINNRPQMIFNATGACAGLRVPVTAAVQEPVEINLGTPVTICAGDVLTLDAGTGASSYEWNTGATTPTIVVSEPGTYQVTVQEGVCTSSSAIEISELPEAQTGTIAVVNNNPSFSFSAPDAIGGVAYTWDFGDGTTATSTTAVHTYTGSGNYTVNFSAVNECGLVSTTSTNVIVSELGIAGAGNPGQQVQVYPNPSAGLTVIEAKGAMITSLDVMDNLGRVVLRSQPQSSKTVLDVKGMAQGVYTLRIQTTLGSSSVKLVVSH